MDPPPASTCNIKFEALEFRLKDFKSEGCPGFVVEGCGWTEGLRFRNQGSEFWSLRVGLREPVCEPDALRVESLEFGKGFRVWG